MICWKAWMTDAGYAVQFYYKIVTNNPTGQTNIGEKFSLLQHQYKHFCFKLNVQPYIFVIMSDNEQ
jgi:hypothetical protein